MKLTYRGVDYESNPLVVELIPGEMGGKYRGQQWRRHYPRHIRVPQPVAELKYRGVPYYVGDPLDVEAMKLRRQPKAIATEKTGQKSGQDLANAHLNHIRRNLEHRLQVAREKGDQTLIRLLEDEARQMMVGS
ncbi:DUF4278 domain-containing protein [Fischerella sp. JS2]|uniref:arginine synthesis PII-interacting regulator PirA n=1 Tax=Fischerella sp. JS2 TaxID=2597771 RepID=UPI0028EDC297|nr:DUF4278 domain-containing protein [Fischerella sp. JS2]